MEQIENLKELINQGDVDTAIEQLNQLLLDTSVENEKDILYYLRGNAYRKKETGSKRWTITSTLSTLILTAPPFRPGKWR